MTRPGRLVIAGWLSLDSTCEARQKVDIEQHWGFIPPLVNALAVSQARDQAVPLDGDNTQRRVSLGGNP